MKHSIPRLFIPFGTGVLLGLFFNAAASEVARDRWDVFTRHGKKSGYTQYRTETLPNGTKRTKQVTVFGKGIQLVVAGFYYEWAGSPLEWSAFGFFNNKEYRTRFERRGDNELYDVEEKDKIWIPTNAYPSQLTQQLIKTMEMTPGAKLDYTILIEGTAQSLGRTQLKVVGEEAVSLYDGTPQKLTRIDQLLDAEPRRIFWVDEQKKIIISDLNGPKNFLTDSSLHARDGHWDWPTLDTVTTSLD